MDRDREFKEKNMRNIYGLVEGELEREKRDSQREIEIDRIKEREGIN